MSKKPTVLIIIDGYGKREEEEGNAILAAKTPNLDRLMDTYPGTSIKTGFVSCEEGYQLMGTGLNVPSQKLMIDKATQDGSLFRNPLLIDLIKYVKENRASLHLVGMLSDAGIHSHINHLFSLLELAQHHFLDKVYMHLILDGRDVETNSARKYLRQLDKYLERNNTGTVATIIGRHYAMDKSKGAKQFKKAYDMLTKGKGTLIRDPMEAVHSAYRKKLSDEFVEPTIINQSGLPKNKDAVIFFNFRSDRANNFLQAFTDPKFKKFPTRKMNLRFISLLGYEDDPIPCAINIPKTKTCLSKHLAGKKMKQFKVCEETKGLAATFFFNGNNSKPFDKEVWKIVGSANVPTYDKKPAMSASLIAKHAVEQIRKNKFDLVVSSFANMDSVGHTGKLNETLKAVEAVDKAVGNIVKVVERKKGVCLITGDHGKAEEMLDRFGRPVTSHSTNPVPVIVTRKGIKLHRGKLHDIAPTVLKLMRLKPPKEMKGKSLY